jgi:hypothetical protein
MGNARRGGEETSECIQRALAVRHSEGVGRAAFKRALAVRHSEGVGRAAFKRALAVRHSEGVAVRHSEGIFAAASRGSATVGTAARGLHPAGREELVGSRSQVPASPAVIAGLRPSVSVRRNLTVQHPVADRGADLRAGRTRGAHILPDARFSARKDTS